MAVVLTRLLLLILVVLPKVVLLLETRPSLPFARFMLIDNFVVDLVVNEVVFLGNVRIMSLAIRRRPGLVERSVIPER